MDYKQRTFTETLQNSDHTLIATFFGITAFLVFLVVTLVTLADFFVGFSGFLGPAEIP
jgi:hypothetical protein